MQREVQARTMMLSGKRFIKSSVSVIVCIIICLCGSTAAFADNRNYTNQDLAVVIQDIVTWKEKSDNIDTSLLSSEFVNSAGSSAADWYAIALGRIGLGEDSSAYLAMLKNNVKKRYATEEKLDLQKSTEWHRIALAVLSLGGDPTDFGQDNNNDSINLIRDGTYDRGKTNSLGAQGINGYIWGLLTLDSMRYTIPQDASETRKDIITAILQNQLTNGSFTLDSTNADVDISGMVLQALAPYYNDEEIYTYKSNDGKVNKNTVRQAVDKALTWLSSVQNDDGDFCAWGEDNAESTIQVMTALCSLGIDPVNDSRFVKKGSVLDGVMKYRMKDGGFAHSLKKSSKNANKSDSIASQQALCGLCALYRYRTGLRSLYDFRTEQPQKLKEKIKSLNKRLDTVPQNKTDASECLSEYLSVPISERSYVYNYHNLAEALQKFNLENRSDSLLGAMNANTNGTGTVINIFDGSDSSTGLVWTEKDMQEYHSLPEKLTNKQYSDVIRLYEKLTQAENAEDYADILPELTEKKNAVCAVHDEIDDMNSQIAQKLYPFDDLSEKDKSMVNDLVSRVEALEECDRDQILGLEDLYKAKAKFDSSHRNMIIQLVVAVLTVVCIISFAIHIRKKKQKRREKNNFSENKDW